MNVCLKASVAAFILDLMSSVSSFLRGNVVEQRCVIVFEISQQLRFKTADFRHRDVIHIPVRRSPDDKHLFFERHRRILPLLENFRQALPTCQQALCGFVQVRTKLRKGRQLPVLRQLQPQRPGNLLHGFRLRRTAHPRNGVADVDGRADAGIEQVRFQKNLTIRNGNHVGRNVGRDVSGLGFDHGQRRQGAAATLVVILGRPFKQPRVEIEDIPG
jgi:hypothetical protein